MLAAPQGSNAVIRRVVWPEVLGRRSSELPFSSALVSATPWLERILTIWEIREDLVRFNREQPDVAALVLLLSVPLFSTSDFMLQDERLF